MAERDWIGGHICFVARSEIRSQMIPGIVAHWDSLRGAREMPRRDEIDPLNLRPWLPYISIVEIQHDPFRVRYRLVGTEVVRIIGEDFSNRWLDETGWTAEAISLNAMLYRRIVETRQPLYGLSTVEYGARPDLVFEWVLLPLSSGGEPVTHCLSLDDLTTIAPRSQLLSIG